MRASYEASGEQNLRAEARVHAAQPNASPSGAGKDAGGTENRGATTVAKQGSVKETPSASRDVRPAAVQTFNDKGV